MADFKMDDFTRRFWSKVDKSGACWQWTGAKTGPGYGAIRTGGRADPLVYAHRVSFEMAHGPIPMGLQIDHLCHGADRTCPGGSSCPHRGCVNPAHLDAVDHAENVRRGHRWGCVA